jgi:hypothetical protein
MTVPVATPTARFMRVIVKRYADTSALDLLCDVYRLPLVFEARQDFDEAPEEGVASDQQEKKHKHRFEEPAGERTGAA